jgi:hypothetical protein
MSIDQDEPLTPEEEAEVDAIIAEADREQAEIDAREEAAEKALRRRLVRQEILTRRQAEQGQS